MSGIEFSSMSTRETRPRPPHGFGRSAPWKRRAREVLVHDLHPQAVATRYKVGVAQINRDVARYKREKEEARRQGRKFVP